MVKKMVANSSSSAVRLTPDAKGKLMLIASRKSTTLGAAASHIILHYASNNLDYEIATADVFKTMLQKLSALVVSTSKLETSTSRTEDFMKSLLRSDSMKVGESTESILSDENDLGASEPVYDERLSRALDILSRFFTSEAKLVKDYKDDVAMQIRIPPEDFTKLKTKYEELCSLQNM